MASARVDSSQIHSYDWMVCSSHSPQCNGKRTNYRRKNERNKKPGMTVRARYEQTANVASPLWHCRFSENKSEFLHSQIVDWALDTGKREIWVAPNRLRVEKRGTEWIWIVKKVSEWQPDEMRFGWKSNKQFATKKWSKLNLIALSYGRHLNVSR